MQNQTPFRAQALSLWNVSEVFWDLLDSTTRALRDTRIIVLDVLQIRERMHEQRMKEQARHVELHWRSCWTCLVNFLTVKHMASFFFFFPVGIHCNPIILPLFFIYCFHYNNTCNLRPIVFGAVKNSSETYVKHHCMRSSKTSESTLLVSWDEQTKK